MREQTLFHIIEDYIRHGNDTAFAQRRGYRLQRWSYRRVVETARQFARELEARNVRPGDRVRAQIDIFHNVLLIIFISNNGAGIEPGAILSS